MLVSDSDTDTGSDQPYPYLYSRSCPFGHIQNLWPQVGRLEKTISRAFPYSTLSSPQLTQATPTLLKTRPNLSLHLPLQSTITCKQDSQTHKLLHLRQSAPPPTWRGHSNCFFCPDVYIFKILTSFNLNVLSLLRGWITHTDCHQMSKYNKKTCVFAAQILPYD